MVALSLIISAAFKVEESSGLIKKSTQIAIILTK